jgi:hypothetical protein
MNTALLFLLIVAWAVALVYTLLTIATVNLAGRYRNNASLRTLDELRGVTRTFPIVRRGVIAFLAWAFIIAYYTTN